MLTPHKDYNFKDGVTLIVGGFVVGGFATEGGIEFEMGDAIYEDVVGADGQVTVSQLHDYRMYATITLMETSHSYKVLFGLLTAQRQQLRKGPLPFAIRDDLNGDTVFVGTAIFMDWPTPSKNRVAGEREFRVLLPDGAEKFAGGAGISIP